MQSPELLILSINIGFIIITYFAIYPRFAGSDGNKICTYDFIISFVSVLIAGVLFWGTGQEFDMLITDLNWFWFSLLSYFAMEIPLMLWYYTKYDVWKSFTL